MEELFNNKNTYNEFDSEKTTNILDIKEANVKYQDISKLEREKLITQYNIRNEKCNILFEQIKKVIAEKDLAHDITFQLGILLYKEFQTGNEILEIINESSKQIDYFNEIIFELTKQNLMNKEIIPKTIIDNNFNTVILNPRDEIKKHKYLKNNQTEIILSLNKKWEEIRKKYDIILDKLLVIPKFKSIVDTLDQLMNEQHQDNSNLFSIFIDMNEHIDVLNEIVINVSPNKENLLTDDNELANNFK